MRRVIIQTALVAGGALALAGCGIADSRSPVPEFMRGKLSETLPEPPPDIGKLVRERLDSVFTTTSYPHHVQVSTPLRDLHGLGWTACVKAELTSVTGKPLGTQIYRITVSGGVIIRPKRRAEEPQTIADPRTTSRSSAQTLQSRGARLGRSAETLEDAGASTDAEVDVLAFAIGDIFVRGLCPGRCRRQHRDQSIKTLRMIDRKSPGRLWHDLVRRQSGIGFHSFCEMPA